MICGCPISESGDNCTYSTDGRNSCTLAAARAFPVNAWLPGLPKKSQ